MVIRPSDEWREGVAEEAALVKAGSLEQEDAVLGKLHPPDLLVRFDEIFDSFERDVAGLRNPSDEEVLIVVQKAVFALNALNDDYESDAIATEERTVLCQYIDRALTEAGLDLDALSARREIPREDITDEWRTW
ncbi:hypothetical protein [Paractinoplanes brasiliensis]|uniref:Uncharacterized protein n=1 Tax=Paractinoplanes brasiliensis TaxID=52695 RepID=A0A4R6JYG8_9ACTN|nr:hypothetical protein [Actinoplanes brasiliensis]TDO41789.1 hypothetical protein C8E87_5532 [Actinoplanes brasiliensis]GID29943.1 hypothetical protein Abr02nite_49260 [Actinoplanes brasiliensis]